MRDKKKFCRPNVTKNPKVGDIYIKLKCGNTVPITAEEYNKIKKFFNIDSFVGSSQNKTGNIVVLNKKVNENMIISPDDLTDNFELVEIIGNIQNPSNGDILVHNNTINEDAVFSFNDWVSNDEIWEITGLYGVTTYEEDEITVGDYIILANGVTFIIKPEDYSKVSNNWEHVDTYRGTETD